MPYLPFAEYKERSIFEESEIDEFFTRPNRVNTYSRWEKGIRGRKIDDKLRRRYAVPFGVVPPATEPDPDIVPEAVKEWLTAYLDARLMRARRDPGSEAEAGDTDNTLEASEATAEIDRAANANEPAHGELPLRADKPESSGVTKGGPMAVSFNTIYGHFDAQAAERDGGGW